MAQQTIISPCLTLLLTTANLLPSYFVSSLSKERLATQTVIASPDKSGRSNLPEEYKFTTRSLSWTEVRFFAPLRTARSEGLAMTKEGRSKMPRGLNKQSYVFQPPCGKVIKDYYLASTLQQLHN